MDHQEQQDRRLSEKTIKNILFVIDILTIPFFIYLIIRQIILLIRFLSGIRNGGETILSITMILTMALFFFSAAVFRLIDHIQEKKEEKMLRQMRDTDAASALREQAEGRNYYRRESRKWIFLLLGCVIAVVYAVLLLFSIFNAKFRPGGAREVRDVWNAAAYLFLALGMVMAARAINGLRDISREKKGIAQQETRKTSRTIYVIFISLGLMLILSLAVYFHDPTLQLEVRYGFRSHVAMKIHPEKDPELVFDYEIYISELDDQLYIDLYTVDVDYGSHFIFSSAFQKNLTQEGWVGMRQDNTRIQNGKMESVRCYIAAKRFGEDRKNGTIETEDYGKLEIYTQPCQGGFVTCVICSTEDEIYVRTEDWPWLDLIDAEN